ncbi:MAG TPA: trehalase family glycosidase [Candidatus Saccharimonadales bacterium]
MQDTDLLAAAKAVLKENDQGNYTVPAEHLYPHQWLWDSCFTAIGLRHLDAERAKMELLSLLRGQWHNGMLPNIIFNSERQYRTDRSLWRSWLNPNAPEDIATSGITQPPMIAEAVMRVGEKLEWPERRQWYRMVWPALLAYHSWLYRERDPHGEGLALQIHPWEVGLDNTPPWMAEMHEHSLPGWIRALEYTHVLGIAGLFRRDRKAGLPVKERLSTLEALALFDIQRRLRRKAYDIDKILDHSLFAIEDLTFNSILIRANTHLEHIAESIREDIPDNLAKSIEEARRAFDDLWDPYSGQYFSRDFITHKLLKEPSIATLMPLYAGCISQDRAAQLVQLLENEHLFGPAYPVPSVPINSTWFHPKRYWQGPTWVNTNWLIIDGLKRYGFKDHAAALRESTLEMVGHGGFAEYFDPLTGERAGGVDFSWTAALTIDLLKN